MGRITLVCTAHTENGLCNENELLEILQAIGPDVIFEELRSADFDAFYGDKSKHTLEMRAVTRYLKSKKARQVPVDDYEAPKDFGPKIVALDKFVEWKSREYCVVIDEMKRMKAEFGFSYLNSPNFVSHANRSDQLYREAVSTYGNDAAKSMLSMWNEQVRKRDSSMLENIYEFCRKCEFVEGVFLVGAGHMSAIVEGIQVRMKEQPTLVAWKFWNRL